jgi:hypothetical protein
MIREATTLKEPLLEEHLNLISATHLREVLRYIAQTSHLEHSQAEDYCSLITSPTEPGFNFIAGIGENQECYLPLIGDLKKRNIPFAWFSYPFTPTLDVCLRAHGLAPLAPLANVVCDLKHGLPQRPQQSNLSFIPVTTSSLFKTWCEINASVWNRSLDLTMDFFKGLSPEINAKSRMQLFLVQKNNKYVGSSLIDIQHDIAGCYWDCVLQEYRRQGIGSEMVYHRQELAKLLGCSFIVAQCLDSSLGVYLKAGFQKGSPLALYR